MTHPHTFNNHTKHTKKCQTDIKYANSAQKTRQKVTIKKFTKNKPFKSNKKNIHSFSKPHLNPKTPPQKNTKNSNLHIIFYLYKTNHTPTKLNPTNQTPTSDPQFLLVILNSQTATLKLGSSNKTTTKKNRQSQSPTDLYRYFIMAKLVVQDIPCNDLKN